MLLLKFGSVILVLILALAACKERNGSGSALAAASDTGCKVSMRYRVDGVWPSFSNWFFEINNNELVTSYTDDLKNPKDWETSLHVNARAHKLTVEHYDFAADEIIGSIMHFNVICEGEFGKLSPIAAYTTSKSLESGGKDSISNVSIKLVPIP